MSVIRFSSLINSEWILTNGLGGYALGFGDMIPKRKYSSLLTASLGKNQRIHILSAIEEKVEGEGTFFFLDSNHYAHCIHPDGYHNIVRSWLRPYPCVLYSLPGCKDYIIFKEIFLLKGHNAVVVKYSNLGHKPLRLTLRPKFTLRDHHHVNPPGTWDRLSPLQKEIRGSSFHLKRPDNGYQVFGFAEGAEIYSSDLIYRGVYYPLEAIRGYEAVEDQAVPVTLIFSLSPETSASVIFSTESLGDPKKSAIEGEKFYKQLPLPVNHPDRVPREVLLEGTPEDLRLFDEKSYRKILEFAARDFILNDEDIIAGYPWFGSWGRDTLISLSAFKYLSGGGELALKILHKYGCCLKEGLLPNTFGEGGIGLNYDSIDAPLWFVVRGYQFAPRDEELLAASTQIILNYLYGKNHPFVVAEDGLIQIHPGDHALTWMDAKVYGVPVTPRHGKPIEINALWYNALCSLRERIKGVGACEMKTDSFSCSLEVLEGLIKKVSHSLQKFVGDRYLADRLEEGDVPLWEVRPNSVIALSLPFDFVDKAVMKRVWMTAREELLAPRGLRSLHPAHPAFKQRYVGNPLQRDLAYHQGTVWTYLLLPLALLTWKVLRHERSIQDIHREISGYLWVFRNGFMKGNMASVAEIGDGVGGPSPKGCPAQAWSVFALFEIENFLEREMS
ncbi:MAG: hypothetical protein A2053_02975 [Deltaproteobacteria bacterium GWA2_50_8]|nr:MAG: hypothetical protein A2053_02975 [Deltaproteobacteria bacterium GWA2_50_8]OGQ25752.1 MAG: hypothetical protein A3B79_06145 [Deltaproteobacteria bacterium RIFCSPHIGHO2_02_FULL_50_15]